MMFLNTRTKTKGPNLFITFAVLFLGSLSDAQLPTQSTTLLSDAKNHLERDAESSGRKLTPSKPKPNFDPKEADNILEALRKNDQNKGSNSPAAAASPSTESFDRVTEENSIGSKGGLNDVLKSIMKKSEAMALNGDSGLSSTVISFSKSPVPLNKLNSENLSKIGTAAPNKATPPIPKPEKPLLEGSSLSPMTLLPDASADAGADAGGGKEGAQRLKNVPSIMSPKLLFNLAMASPSDRIVFLANDFPTDRLVKDSSKIVRMDGQNVDDALEAVMKLITVCKKSKNALVHLNLKNDTDISDASEPEQWKRLEEIVAKEEGQNREWVKMSMEEFIHAAKHASILIQTSDPSEDSCIIIKKGHIGNVTAENTGGLSEEDEDALDKEEDKEDSMISDPESEDGESMNFRSSKFKSLNLSNTEANEDSKNLSLPKSNEDSSEISSESKENRGNSSEELPRRDELMKRIFEKKRAEKNSKLQLQNSPLRSLKTNFSNIIPVSQNPENLGFSLESSTGKSTMKDSGESDKKGITISGSSENEKGSSGNSFLPSKEQMMEKLFGKKTTASDTPDKENEENEEEKEKDKSFLPNMFGFPENTERKENEPSSSSPPGDSENSNNPFAKFESIGEKETPLNKSQDETSSNEEQDKLLKEIQDKEKIDGSGNNGEEKESVEEALKEEKMKHDDILKKLLQNNSKGNNGVTRPTRPTEETSSGLGDIDFIAAELGGSSTSLKSESSSAAPSKSSPPLPPQGATTPLADSVKDSLADLKGESLEALKEKLRQLKKEEEENRKRALQEMMSNGAP